MIMPQLVANVKLILALVTIVTTALVAKETTVLVAKATNVAIVIVLVAMEILLETAV